MTNRGYFIPNLAIIILLIGGFTSIIAGIILDSRMVIGLGSGYLVFLIIIITMNYRVNYSQNKQSVKN